MWEYRYRPLFKLQYRYRPNFGYRCNSADVWGKELDEHVCIITCLERLWAPASSCIIWSKLLQAKVVSCILVYFGFLCCDICWLVSSKLDLFIIISHSLLWRHIVLLTIGVYSSNHRLLYTIRISVTRRFQKSVCPFVRL